MVDFEWKGCLQKGLTRLCLMTKIQRYVGKSQLTVSTKRDFPYKTFQLDNTGQHFQESLSLPQLGESIPSGYS